MSPRGLDHAKRLQGEWFAALRPRRQVALLREVNPSSIEAVCDTAGFGWLRTGR